MRCIKSKSREKILENPEVTRSQLFDDLGRVFLWTKITYLTIAKSSVTVFSNIIFDQRLERM